MSGIDEIETLKATIKSQSSCIMQLEETAQSNMKWLSFLSHELNGFFANIQWISDVVASQSISEATVLNRLMPELKEQAVRNGALLREAHSWFKHKAQAHLACSGEIAVADLFNTLKIELKEKLENKNLHFECCCKEYVSVVTNPFLLKIVLNKILDNAIKFSFPDNKIVMSCDMVAETGLTQICIKDFGIGFDYKKSESFALGGQTYLGTNNEKGHGIGLFLAKDYLEMIGGAISISSELKKGTVVQIDLPNK